MLQNLLRRLFDGARQRAGAVTRGVGAVAGGVVLILSIAASQPALAQNGRPAQSGQGGPAWSTLTPAQRSSLAPLERDWASIDPQRKQKWLEISARMPKMPPEERERMQARMHEWAGMSAQERGQARLHYQESRQLSPQEKQQRWEAYQALPPEQRRQFAVQAAPVIGKPAARSIPSTKSNLVPDPAEAGKPRVVGPTVIQAKPGATTTLITRRPTPPAHQQTGLPKIAATPDFVDRTTLLPRKGPQGAATRSAAPASAPK